VNISGTDPAKSLLISGTMRTASMFPLVPVGSHLHFEKTKKFRPGDLVLFMTEKGIVCHRLIHFNTTSCVTWGDWRRHPDPEREVTELIGRCIIVYRKGKAISLDWPLMRLINLTVAQTLPWLKRKSVPFIKWLETPTD
jgi:hypothetical protein